MAKRHKHPQSTLASFTRERIRARLRAADTLVEEDRPKEALTLLAELADRYPESAEVLEALLNLSLDTGDMPRYQETAARLLELQPENADLALAEAGAAMENIFPLTALERFRRFLARWPEHPKAQEARKSKEAIERALPELFERLGLEGETRFSVGLQHERIQHLLALGRLREVRRAAEKLIAEEPNLAAARNNLAYAAWQQGELSEAERVFREVLDRKPDNVHALSNLARLLATLGREEEARALADRLKASSAPANDRWLKVAEALIFLGDDEGVLDALARQEEKKGRAAPASEALLRHLAAVAAARQGDTKRARKLWEEALLLNPGLEPAQENLEALDLPPALRPAPWAFPVEGCISPALLRRIRESIKAARNDKEYRATVRRLLETVPGLRASLLLLLNQGDPEAIRLALVLLGASGEAPLEEAVKRFALGERGSIHERVYAARIAREAGGVPEEELQIWTGKRRYPLRWLDHEVTDEPERKHSRRVESLGEQALLAMRDGRAEEGERLLREALELEPESPDLLNNLAAAFQLQGRIAEGMKLAEEVHTRWPDYFFGRCAVARMRAQKGRLEEARKLLEPLLEQRRLHRTELAALYAARIDLLLAEGDKEGARVWLDLMEDKAPDDPQLLSLRMKLAGARALLGDLARSLLPGKSE